MIRCLQQNVAIDGLAEAGQDYVKVIRPINDVTKEEVELEPPEEEQFGEESVQDAGPKAASSTGNR